MWLNAKIGKSVNDRCSEIENRSGREGKKKRKSGERWEIRKRLLLEVRVGLLAVLIAVLSLCQEMFGCALVSLSKEI